MQSAFKRVGPEEAARLTEAGAVMVDVREPDEHARERIDGAVPCPLSSFEHQDLPAAPLLFHCRSGARTAANAPRLAQKAGAREWYVLEGGLDAWRRSDLPVLRDRRRPIEVQRQVHIAAGAMVLTGTTLGLLLSPWFLILPLFVGAGLTLAGLTGFCGMARLLMKAPWNQVEIHAASIAS